MAPRGPVGLGATWAVDPGHLVPQVKAIAPSGVHAALHLAGDGDLVAALLADQGRLWVPLNLTHLNQRAAL